MAKYRTRLDEERAQRFRRWFAPHVGVVGLRQVTLAFYEGRITGGAPRRVVRAWHDGTTTILPDKAFTLGEVLRALKRQDANGPLALYAAGYLGELVGFIATLSKMGADCAEDAPALAALIPAAVPEARPDLAWPPGIPERARAILARIVPPPDVFATAWKRWGDRETDRGLPELLRTAMRLAKDPDLEDETVSLLYRWAERAADARTLAFVRPLHAAYRATHHDGEQHLADFFVATHFIEDHAEEVTR